MITPEEERMNIDEKTGVEVEPSLHMTPQQEKDFHFIIQVLQLSPYAPERITVRSPIPVPCDVEGNKKSAISLKTVNAILLQDLSQADPNDLLTQLEDMLFEKLMMDKDSLQSPGSMRSYSIPMDHFLTLTVTSISENLTKEHRQLHYLYQSYFRLIKGRSDPRCFVTQELIENLRQKLISQAAIYLSQAGLYPDDPSNSRFIRSLVKDYFSDCNHIDILPDFLEAIAEERINKAVKDGESLVPFSPVESNDVYSVFKLFLFDAIQDETSKCKLIDTKLMDSMTLLQLFTSRPILAKLFLVSNSPWMWFPCREYDFKKGFHGTMAADIQKTLFGQMLSISCLPKIGEQPEYFGSEPSKTSHDQILVTERNISSSLKIHVEKFHTIFLQLFKFKGCKKLLLNWIGLALHAFKDRGKMWTNISGAAIMDSDGFLLNLSHVLLRLCLPFCNNKDNKLLKIDPRYVLGEPLGDKEDPANDNEHKIVLRSLKDETFITPWGIDGSNEKPNVDSLKVTGPFNFMTEIFYLTHKTLEMGFKACNERFVRISTDLNSLQRLLRDSRGTPAEESVRSNMDRGLIQYYTLKAALGQVDYLEAMIRLHVSSCCWLNNLTVACDPVEASKEFKEITVNTLNKKDLGNMTLPLIPEFILENISEMVVYLRRFGTANIMTLSRDDMESVFTLILLFMGSSDRIKNPHVRAKFADVLEAMMPSPQESQHHPQQVTPLDTNGPAMFVSHPLVSQLIPTLLNVFVSIELTGQSVQFEQKFQYRRPMYAVLKYLWYNVRDPHRDRMIQLANEALNHIEDSDPPLFLRFVNLLMNDANYLLDESLRFMKMLREMQQKRPEWATLPQQQQQQNNANYHHHGRLARFHNVISRDTISTLAWLTEEIKGIFCSPTLVSRIAEMLNYFLKFLVGPEKNSFKVQDMEEFDFQPADVVHDISLLYINLSSNDKFKMAVATDGRSYSAGLLSLASDVLLKKHKSTNGLAEKMRDLSTECDDLQAQSSAAEINPDDIPDEFLDPIMNSLMTDPVTLPSKNIMDRTTIARHILSDQKDPFTMQPLTMEMVVPNLELKARIEEFVKNYKDKGKS